jgi:hypothetical protein
MELAGDFGLRPVPAGFADSDIRQACWQSQFSSIAECEMT